MAARRRQVFQSSGFLSVNMPLYSQLTQPTRIADLIDFPNSDLGQEA